MFNEDVENDQTKQHPPPDFITDENEANAPPSAANDQGTEENPEAVQKQPADAEMDVQPVVNPNLLEEEEQPSVISPEQVQLPAALGKRKSKQPSR